MKPVISRAFFYFLLFSFIAGSFLLAFLGLPSIERWSVLWRNVEAGLPAGVWLLLLIAALAAGISWTAEWTMRDQLLAARRVLDAFVQNDDGSVASQDMKAVPPALSAPLREVHQLVQSQRASLARISNERAENQDRLIQERIVMERQRLARELHDSVSQQLFAASMLLSAMTEGKEAEPMLMQTEKMIQQAQLEMRALLLHLRPAALHDKSLREGLSELLSELKEKVYFKIDHKLEEVPLPKGAEDHLFRIAQETLSNTLRHSQATEVHILFVERDGLAILRIQDNGVGFESEKAKTASYGLRHIEERAIEIGAVSKIVSVPSEGTIVEVKLPIGKQQPEPIHSLERRTSNDPNSARR